MALAPDEKSLFVLARQPRALIAVDLDRFQPSWSVALPGRAVGAGSFRRRQSGGHHLRRAAFGWWTWRRGGCAARCWRASSARLQFRADGNLLIAANRGARMLSLIDPA